MIVIAVVAAVFLAAAAGMALVRIVRGPSTLDRIVATDVLLAITVCAIATEAAYSRDATGLPILLGLSLLGAVGSIAVARFADPAAKRATEPAVAAFMPAPGSRDAPGGDTHHRHTAVAQTALEPAPADATTPPRPVPVDSGLGDATAAEPDGSPAPEPGATPVSGVPDTPDSAVSTERDEAGRHHHTANGDRS